MIYLPIPVVVGEEKNNGLVTVKLGDHITVRLPRRRKELADEDTYWLLDKDGSPILQFIAGKPSQTDNGLGTHQWQFKAAQEGTTHVRMSYKQTWTGAPKRTYRLTIRVILPTQK